MLSRRLCVVLMATVSLLGLAGCSWLVGVSDDPVVVGDPADASDEDEDGGVEDAGFSSWRDSTRPRP